MTEKITVRQSVRSIITAARYLAAEAFLKLCRLCGLIPTPKPEIDEPIGSSPTGGMACLDKPFRVSHEDGRKLADILDGCSSVMPMGTRPVSSTYCGETSFCGHSPCPDKHCVQGGGHLLRKEPKEVIHDITS